MLQNLSYMFDVCWIKMNFTKKLIVFTHGRFFSVLFLKAMKCVQENDFLVFHFPVINVLLVIRTYNFRIQPSTFVYGYCLNEFTSCKTISVLTVSQTAPTQFWLFSGSQSAHWLRFKGRSLYSLIWTGKNRQAAKIHVVIKKKLYYVDITNT